MATSSCSLAPGWTGRRNILRPRGGARETPRQDTLYRWRALRSPTGRGDVVRVDATGVGPGGGALVYFAFDLLEHDGADIAGMVLLVRKERLAKILKAPPVGVAYSDHEGGVGEAFRRAACQLGLEGVVSKRADRPYQPGDRSAWIKSKCLNRAEFVIVGWSDPEGSRPLLGALLLGYYEPDGRLLYAGRVGTGMPVKTLAMLHARLKPLALKKMALGVAPPRKTRFGGPLALSKVHWVRPELVAEITYLSWSEDGLLRHTVFLGLREDKPANTVRREVSVSANRVS